MNPFNNGIGILLQRLRVSGWYSPTTMPELTLFVEDDLLRRTGWQPSSINAGPGNPYNFTSGALRPINYTQNDLRTGMEYDQESRMISGRFSRLGCSIIFRPLIMRRTTLWAGTSRSGPPPM